MRTPRLLVWIFLLLVVGAPVRAESSRGELLEALERAEARFNEAARQVDSNPAAAEQDFDEAIKLWRRVLDEGRLASGPIYYNIGNAYLLSDEVGRAILAYRRAERLMGHDENLAANLSQARQRVRSRIDPPARDRAARLLLFWHHDLSSRSRFMLLGLGFASFWIFAGVRLAPGARGMWCWWAMGLALTLSAAMLGSLLVERRANAMQREGVVVAPSAVGRRGPDATVYVPTFSEPLFQGVEFRIVEQRVGWMLVELGDGRTTWLERSAVEVI